MNENRLTIRARDVSLGEDFTAGPNIHHLCLFPSFPTYYKYMCSLVLISLKFLFDFYLFQVKHGSCSVTGLATMARTLLLFSHWLREDDEEEDEEEDDEKRNVLLYYTVRRLFLFERNVRR